MKKINGKKLLAIAPMALLLGLCVACGANDNATGNTPGVAAPDETWEVVDDPTAPATGDPGDVVDMDDDGDGDNTTEATDNTDDNANGYYLTTNAYIRDYDNRNNRR